MLRLVERAYFVRLRASSPSADKSVKFEVGKVAAVGFVFSLKLTVVDEFSRLVVHCFLPVEEGVQIVLVPVYAQVGFDSVEYFRPIRFELLIVVTAVYELNGDVAAH